MDLQVTGPGGLSPHSYRDNVEVAIICALPLEHDAVWLALDEVWADNDDHPSHKLGRIGKLNIVLALLPGMGKAQAASTAADIRAKYRRIRVAFVVGICGGVPIVGEKEIVLGDVVISDAIVQYDFGRQYPGRFERKNDLEDPTIKPDKDVRTLLAILRTIDGQERLQKKTAEFLRLLQADAMQRGHGSKYHYPGVEEDRLFHPNYPHKHDATPRSPCPICKSGPDMVCENAATSTCDSLGCDQQLLVERIRLEDKRKATNGECQDPSVHIGVVGSGDMVIKSGKHRDEISFPTKILAFEMEGAGVAVEIPCVVVKGVCDYADCHKNKKWQNFAAATAASALRSLLESYVLTAKTQKHLHDTSVPVRHCHQSNRSSYELNPSSQSHQPKTKPDGKDIEDKGFEKEIQTVEELLRFSQIDERLMSLEGAHRTTCTWFLHKEHYKHWLDKGQMQQHNGFLWVKGKPGIGKSVLVKFLLSQAKAVAKTDSKLLVLSFFFHAGGEELERTTLGAYRSLLWQLHQVIKKKNDKNMLAEYLNERDSAKSRLIRNKGWQLNTLKDAFGEAIVLIADCRLQIYIDALDECSDNEVEDMISFFDDLGERAAKEDVQLSILFSSRHYPNIVVKRGTEVALENEAEHMSDISKYITSKLGLRASSRRDHLERQILRKSQGIFLWVVLVVRLLNRSCAQGRVDQYQSCLEGIPEGLERLFKVILNRGNIDQLQLCIQWILFAQRPLTPLEYLAAVCGEMPLEEQHAFTYDDLRNFVKSSSQGLAEIVGFETSGFKTAQQTAHQSVHFIHESVRDYFRLETTIHQLWPRIAKTFEASSQEALRDRCSESIKSENTSLLIQYARGNVLRHAENAQRHGSSQDQFLATYPLPKFINSKGSSRLWVFAAFDLPCLVRADVRSDTQWNPRLFEPFIVAFQRLNIAAAQELARPVLQNEHDLGGFVNRLVVRRSDLFQISMGNLLSPWQNVASPAKTRLLSLLFDFDYEPLIRSYLDWDPIDLNVPIDLEYRFSDVGKMPLYLARSEDVEALLLRRGADIKLMSDAISFFTAKSTTLIQALFAIGISPDHRNSHGETALMKARTIEKIKALLAIGANPNIKEPGGKTALHLAVQSNDTDSVSCLISWPTLDVNQRDDQGRSPIFYAAEKTPEITTLLLSRSDLDIDLQDYRGWTALFFQAWQRDYKTVGALIVNEKCRFDLTDNCGRTVMHWKARESNFNDCDYQVFELLLKAGGVEMLRADWKGETPGDIARRYGHSRLSRFLDEYEKAGDWKNTQASASILRNATPRRKASILQNHGAGTIQVGSLRPSSST